ncbi:hypothetical protein KP79_PYT16557 [Mizuhopecten yessoensis]|uniref:Core-binding (CB) domain-containing protein n=1 Tax=Mizuhopecten yessoensis TaxID=6573 RepID=A0A210PTJ2_MIZYE|nr:hypothetical protein KP79_PYT16557 [Mizuhopecten yessoensis]
MAARFASRNDDEIKRIRTDLSSRNTQKSNKRSTTTLKAYLTEKQQPSNFKAFDKVALNETLSHFYMDLRKPDGKMYKATSVENIRHSLAAYFLMK